MSSIAKFLESLSDKKTNIPLHTSWRVRISGIPGTINQVGQLDGTQWQGVGEFGDISLFAQTVTNAADSYGIGVANILNNGGLLPGIISTGRSDVTGRQLRIGFRETEKSFVDSVVKPWVIAGAHYGRIADSTGNDLKKTIYVEHLGRDGSPRKIITYYKCTPTGVETGSFNYDGGSQIDIFDTQWIYDNYSINNS